MGKENFHFLYFLNLNILNILIFGNLKREVRDAL